MTCSDRGSRSSACLVLSTSAISECRTYMIITKKQIENAQRGRYSVEERVSEAGFVHFPGGRVVWAVSRVTNDLEIKLFAGSGDRPTKAEQKDMMELLAL